MRKAILIIVASIVLFTGCHSHHSIGVYVPIVKTRHVNATYHHKYNYHHNYNKHHYYKHHKKYHKKYYKPHRGYYRRH
ncbi:hypothetical protein [Poseidonibacter lekithochrous]|uniref:hypothetical protein n=1 Tax=Poseidonibacter lekithochrous TaxID=1904463 RepID=UPI0008FC5B57|nr:hypothetical protein [Poseidonibacter lekithochrous]QKJ22652.1 hypothetical protein ALEK_1378 [Poseidonibacter lekithochrous]